MSPETLAVYCVSRYNRKYSLLNKPLKAVGSSVMSHEVHNPRYNNLDPNATEERPVVLSHGKFPTQAAGAHDRYEPQPLVEPTPETDLDDTKEKIDPKAKKRVGRLALWAGGIFATATGLVTALVLHNQASKNE